mgnify:CR=1 FL=1
MNELFGSAEDDSAYDMSEGEISDFDANLYQPPQFDEVYYQRLLHEAEEERLRRSRAGLIQLQRVRTVSVIRQIYGTKIDAKKPIEHVGASYSELVQRLHDLGKKS